MFSRVATQLICAPMPLHGLSSISGIPGGTQGFPAPWTQEDRPAGLETRPQQSREWQDLPSGPRALSRQTPGAVSKGQGVSGANLQVL